MLANWIGASMENVTFQCAGINHQAFFLAFKVNGEDAYPQILAAAEDPKIVKDEAVRIEMRKGLGYFVTESSGHNAEYNAWFRKRQDPIDRYVPNSFASSVKIITERTNTRDGALAEILEKEDIDLRRGNEYAASKLTALLGDEEMFEFNGNVVNTGLITNLPQGVIVEVPVIASKKGIRPITCRRPTAPHRCVEHCKRGVRGTCSRGLYCGK